ncbi:MAG: NAD(P)-dependent oxidoreductase [Verrucomicrobiae bacterium]|nr:NAD(P)-dependent oxidoreductase [Verrucomicrobiae bacterium]
MKILVTGSSGHLGEALMRTLRDSKHEPVGIDIKASPFTDRVGSIADRDFIRQCMEGVQAVLHTATLHKPHVATHRRQEFIDTNVTGTLNLLEESVSQGVGAFIFTSTTSAFGDANAALPDQPAAWITEAVASRPKNIYGVTKTAAEDLCQLFHRNQQLPCLVLRTSRFFPEDDDSKLFRDAFDQTNLKVNELLYRRADISDIVDAHLLAIDKAPKLGFGKFIISATTPFASEHLAELRHNAPAVVERLVPEYAAIYKTLGWKMLPGLDRVYVNAHARDRLGWKPKFDFAQVLQRLEQGEEPFSELARLVGSKGYHNVVFEDGPFPVE